MTPEQFKEATFLLTVFQPLTYQVGGDVETLLKFDQSQKPKQSSEGKYIEGIVMTEDDIISELRKSLDQQETWVHRCQELITSFSPERKELKK